MKLKFNWKKQLKNFAGLAVSIGALFTVFGQGEVASAATNFVRTNGSCLNVRTGPSTNYRVVACVRNGATLQSVVRYRNGFAQLSNGNWVAANYISSRPTSPGVGGRYSAYVNTNGSCLRTHTGPSTNYRVTGCLPNGTRLSVARYSNGYAQLSSGSWVSTNWISSRTTANRPVSNGIGGAYLRRGSTGSAVRAVQDALDIRRDGVYGAETESAVRRFQAGNGLLVDGVVGPQTRRAIQRMVGSV